ncbi:HTH domain-containing protein, partial [Stenotrophomonas maltophilia group sp. RNC7]|uniref:HTH domain-containing protein n=1 Tax=Stenotrophomonas maltophilia group sp. RNC7 TaxID=3071467 RepID=UPI0027E03ACB
KFQTALKLAKETDLSAAEIAEKTGVNYQTAYRYVKANRASAEEIEEVKNRQKEKQAPVTTYQLTPEELEKYRLDKPNVNPGPKEIIETVATTEKSKMEPIIEERPVKKVEIPKADNG